MTSDPTGGSHPTGNEPEPRWQQPPLYPDPANDTQPYAPSPFRPQPFMQSGQGMQPVVSGPVLHVIAAPSVFETIVGTLARLVWPVAILLIIFAHLSFWPVIITAIVAGALLGGVKKNLRARRRAVLPPPPHFGTPHDLR